MLLILLSSWPPPGLPFSSMSTCSTDRATGLTISSGSVFTGLHQYLLVSSRYRFFVQPRPPTKSNLSFECPLTRNIFMFWIEDQLQLVVEDPDVNLLVWPNHFISEEIGPE